jgi:IPT/TIG domain
MSSSRVKPYKPSRSIRIALLAILTLLLSSWTCRIGFDSCQGVAQQPQITSISPSTVPGDANSVPLTVDGSGFTPRSQILWNGSTLDTTFINSHRLQATITHDTFESFGGSAGSNVQISVRSPGSGCPISGNSTSLNLLIN